MTLHVTCAFDRFTGARQEDLTKLPKSLGPLGMDHMLARSPAAMIVATAA